MLGLTANQCIINLTHGRLNLIWLQGHFTLYCMYTTTHTILCTCTVPVQSWFDTWSVNRFSNVLFPIPLGGMLYSSFIVQNNPLLASQFLLSLVLHYTPKTSCISSGNEPVLCTNVLIHHNWESCFVLYCRMAFCPLHFLRRGIWLHQLHAIALFVFGYLACEWFMWHLLYCSYLWHLVYDR